jgi:excisionase family DNA binding protein
MQQRRASALAARLQEARSRTSEVRDSSIPSVSVQSTVAPLRSRLLTVKQAAAYMSSPVWTVRTLIWGREIKVIRKGKAYLIPIEELDSWIDRTKALL